MGDSSTTVSSMLVDVLKNQIAGSAADIDTNIYTQSVLGDRPALLLPLQEATRHLLVGRSLAHLLGQKLVAL